MADITPWQAHIITLFPDMFPGPLSQALAGKALSEGRWSVETYQLRDFALNKHRSVDDTPMGGGAGMVLRPDVMSGALDHLSHKAGPRLYFSPRGRVLDQAFVHELAEGPGAVMVCGRYEGLDQRVIDTHQLIEVSIGDYILAGGEMAALVTLDAVVRLLDGVMGNAQSFAEESFETGLLEHPLYTQPRHWEGHDVPDILLSGHHQAIADWRQSESEKLTAERRPDLWARYRAERSQTTAKKISQKMPQK